MAKCDICGHSGVRSRRVTRTYGKGQSLVVIQNIPMRSCPKCGESYFTSETLREIERLKLHHKALSVKRSVEVVVYA